MRLCHGGLAGKIGQTQQSREDAQKVEIVVAAVGPVGDSGRGPDRRGHSAPPAALPAAANPVSGAAYPAPSAGARLPPGLRMAKHRSATGPVRKPRWSSPPWGVTSGSVQDPFHQANMRTSFTPRRPKPINCSMPDTACHQPLLTGPKERWGRRGKEAICATTGH